jgi:hypothetical protein
MGPLSSLATGRLSFVLAVLTKGAQSLVNEGGMTKKKNLNKNKSQTKEKQKSDMVKGKESEAESKLGAK